jgi:hypothetical protein
MSAVRFRPTDARHRVTTLELFFDLVFVFAFTQVTQLMADHPTPTGALQGLVVLALLWFAWCSYAWLGNQAYADESVVRLTMITAMTAMFVVALTIPESFDDLPGGLFAPLVLAAGYALVRVAQLACYFVDAADDAGLRRQLLLTSIPVIMAVVLLVVGGLTGPRYQAGLWALALNGGDCRSRRLTLRRGVLSRTSHETRPHRVGHRSWGQLPPTSANAGTRKRCTDACRPRTTLAWCRTVTCPTTGSACTCSTTTRSCVRGCARCSRVPGTSRSWASPALP